MVNFYVYSFSIAAIPLLLGVLLIWFGCKINNILILGANLVFCWISTF